MLNKLIRVYFLLSYRCLNSFKSFQQFYVVDIMLMYRQVIKVKKLLIYSHIANKFWGENLNSGHVIRKATYLIT